jgi:hypothetical protein
MKFEEWAQKNGVPADRWEMCERVWVVAQNEMLKELFVSPPSLGLEFVERLRKVVE